MEVRDNGSIAEDPAAVVDVLEASLLAWANDWAATVLPGDKVTTDEASTTCVNTAGGVGVCRASTCLSLRMRPGAVHTPVPTIFLSLVP